MWNHGNYYELYPEGGGIVFWFWNTGKYLVYFATC